ncbi:MAG: cytidylate kinase [Desulfococcus sp. 4484_242]|nr:MAG: cytidylate kinase [Desulfococcus sp. 4484_242]
MNDIVTIDGPGGSGKSTVSRMLASKIRYSYLDTGAMYRAVALAAQRRGVDLHEGPALGDLCRALDLWFDAHKDPPRLMLGHEDISGLIRTSELDMLSSAVSAVREVREAMADLQRRMGKEGRLVAEGRDMGTVVFPAARFKFYLTASLEARTERRFRERVGRGERVVREDVARELKIRDDQDRLRSLSPLKPAPDAVVIDSTGLTAEEVVQEMVRYIQGARSTVQVSNG